MPSLHEVLAEVRPRIERAPAKGLNEQDTKATLIEPVLRALGWDTQDIDEVAREYREKSRDKPVDYALLVLREPRLFVEAKGLGKDLNDRRWANQIMGYAAVAGVEWIILTNGDEYRIYNTHASVKVDEKMLVSVRISEDPKLAEEMLGLLSKKELATNRIRALWEAQFVDRQVRSAIEQLFSRDQDMLLVNHIKKHAEDLSPADIRGSLRRCKFQIDFPVSPDELLPRVGGGRGKKSSSKSADRGKIASYGVSLAEMIDAGILRPPVELSRRYKGKTFTARIMRDGTVECLGERLQSLSQAGAIARKAVIGLRPDGKLHATNGWTFWKYKAPDGKTREIDHARQAFLKGRTGSQPGSARRSPRAG